VNILIFSLIGAIGVITIVNNILKKSQNKEMQNQKDEQDNNFETITNRQKKILDLFENDEEVSMNIIKKNIKSVSPRTLRRDLDHLEEKGLILKEGVTKGSYYVKIV
jgi:predicted HTH transcriptional regulator